MPPIIEASGLVKRFGKTVALDGLDLQANEREILAILGPGARLRTPGCRSTA